MADFPAFIVTVGNIFVHIEPCGGFSAHVRTVADLSAHVGTCNDLAAHVELVADFSAHNTVEVVEVDSSKVVVMVPPQCG